MKKQKIHAKLLIIVIVLLALAGCGKKIPEDTLVIIADENPDNLVPILAQNFQARLVSELMYQGLTGETGRRHNEIENELAEEIIQEKGCTHRYLVKLKKNVNWHDGTLFSAKDVLYTWRAIRNPQNASPQRGRLNAVIDSIEELDTYRLRVVFNYSIAPDDARWILSFRIIPHLYRNQKMPDNLNSGVGRQFAENPIGTGPFRFQSRNEYLAVDTSQAIKRVELQTQQDVQLRINNLIKGRADLVFNVDPEFYEELDKKQLPSFDYTPKGFYCLVFNTDSAPFSDPAVRQAVSSALDRDLINRKIWGHSGEKYSLNGPFPRNDSGVYRGRVEAIQSYDPDIAKKRIRESTYQSDPVDLLISENMRSVGRIAASQITGMLESIGMKVNISFVGRAFSPRIMDGRFQMALVFEHGFGRKYDHFALYHSAGNRNKSRIKDEQLDSVLLQWDNTILSSEKLQYGKEMNERLKDLTPIAYISQPPQRGYYSRSLRDLLIMDEDALLKTVATWRKSGK